jgi:hypothetical protein
LPPFVKRDARVSFAAVCPAIGDELQATSSQRTAEKRDRSAVR